ncbi:MAG: uroporphyrinogen-III synthase, partial [Trueperaceae bacterium]
MSDVTSDVTVVLTHGAGRLDALAPALHAAGLRTVHRPLTEVRPHPEAKPEARDLLALPWLLFASRSAVDAWTAFGLPLPADGPRVGAVGDGTAAALARAGGRATLVGRGTAADLARAFLARPEVPSASAAAVL